MLSTLINRPCTIIRRHEGTTRDAHGNLIPDEEEVETVCELQQRQRSEGDDAGELSDTRWMLFLPAGTEIDTGDGVVVDGQTFEMVGDPWNARNPRTQQESHIEATVRRTAGEETGS